MNCGFGTLNKKLKDRTKNYGNVEEAVKGTGKIPPVTEQIEGSGTQTMARRRLLQLIGTRAGAPSWQPWKKLHDLDYV